MKPFWAETGGWIDGLRVTPPTLRFPAGYFPWLCSPLCAGCLWGSASLSLRDFCSGNTDWHTEWIYLASTLINNYKVGQLGWNPGKMRMKEGEMGFSNFTAGAGPWSWSSSQTNREENQGGFLSHLFCPNDSHATSAQKGNKHNLILERSLLHEG